MSTSRAARGGAVAGVIALALLAGCGRAKDAADAPASKVRLTATTPAAKGPTGPITWALYRGVQTLDPIYVFDFPDNTVITSLCESLMRQQPDGTLRPGLAQRIDFSDPLRLVVDVRPGVRFWDGTAMTAQDVAFSLRRHLDPRLGSFFAQSFDRVRAITVTGPEQVTISLRQPDAQLVGELSGMPGVVVSRRYVQARGQGFGTPAGGTMCTGAFKLRSWKAGGSVVVTANDRYWDAGLRPKVSQITFSGVPDEASLTSGLLTGEIDGAYVPPVSTLDQLRRSSAVRVYSGPSFQSDVLTVGDADGVLGDVRIRRALSLAIDRRAYVKAVYKGAAQLPRTLANPGSWGAQAKAFGADWDALPDPVLDVARGRRLVQQAGATGKPLTIALTSEIASIASAANAVRTAALAIGLKPRLKSSSAADYINLFVDPKARAGVDAIMSVAYPDFADPAAMYAQFAVKGAGQNYSGFDDAAIARDLSEARSEPDAAKRAALTIGAGRRINSLLPWIPMVNPSTTLVMNRKITGAPASFAYMGGPWAAYLGAAG